MAIHMVASLKIHRGVSPTATIAPRMPRGERPVALVTVQVPSKAAGYRTAPGLYFDHSGGGG